MDDWNAGAGSARAAGTGEDDVDLDWIPLDNGWQLAICDEEAWAEMGLTPAGFGRIVDRLQEATAGQPNGELALSQSEVETVISGKA